MLNLVVSDENDEVELTYEFKYHRKQCAVSDEIHDDPEEGDHTRCRPSVEIYV